MKMIASKKDRLRDKASISIPLGTSISRPLSGTGSIHYLSTQGKNVSHPLSRMDSIHHLLTQGKNVSRPQNLIV
jgi:hypothetical protein